LARKTPIPSSIRTKEKKNHRQRGDFCPRKKTKTKTRKLSGKTRGRRTTQGIILRNKGEVFQKSVGVSWLCDGKKGESGGLRLGGEGGVFKTEPMGRCGGMGPVKRRNGCGLGVGGEGTAPKKKELVRGGGCAGKRGAESDFSACGRRGSQWGKTGGGGGGSCTRRDDGVRALESKP